jgi:hypothetical protein
MGKVLILLVRDDMPNHNVDNEDEDDWQCFVKQIKKFLNRKYGSHESQQNIPSPITNLKKD